jgi:amidase
MTVIVVLTILRASHEDASCNANQDIFRQIVTDGRPFGESREPPTFACLRVISSGIVRTFPEGCRMHPGRDRSRREFLTIAGAAAATLWKPSPASVAAPADLAFASAVDAARAIRDGKVSSLELTRHMFERIERHKTLNAVVTPMTDEALSRAREADAARASGKSWGPLHGVPCTIKDAFETKGVRTMAGAPFLKDHVPQSDAALVERLRAAGAVLLGLTNVPPMLMDWQSSNPIFGRSNNPWDVARTPGGSTGGGAAALAAGIGYIALGSDIGGSIRVPAHFCGVYGHKPTCSVLPDRGHIPPPPQARPDPPTGLAAVGPLARSAIDLKLAMEILGGPDADAAIAYKWTLPRARKTRLADYRIGYVIDHPFCPVASDVKAVLARSIESLRKAGVPLREGWPAGVDPAEHLRTYLYLFFSVFAFEAQDEQMEKLRKQAKNTDASWDTLTAQAHTAPHKVFLRKQQRQLQAREAWQQYFREHDAFLMPTAFVAAFPHDPRPEGERRLQTPEGERPYTDLMGWVAPATLAGLPATTAPVGLTASGLPVGIQIVGPYLEDATPIDIAARIADVVGGFRPPPGY